MFRFVIVIISTMMVYCSYGQKDSLLDCKQFRKGTFAVFKGTDKQIKITRKGKYQIDESSNGKSKYRILNSDGNDLMDKSEVLFVTRRNILKGNTGETYAKNSTKVIVRFGDFNSQIHEFKHWFQYLKGEVSFGKNSLSGSGLYDASDEQYAYQRDYAFNPKQKLYTSQDVDNHKKITAGALYREYSNRNITIARGKRSLNTYKGDLSGQFVVDDSNLN